MDRSGELRESCSETPSRKVAKMGLLARLLAAVGGSVTAVMNSITDVFLTPPLLATLGLLEETDLKTLAGGELRCVRIKRC